MFFEFYTSFNLLISQPPLNLNLNLHSPDKNLLSIICRNESESKIGERELIREKISRLCGEIAVIHS